MKKILLIVLSLAMAVSISGCAGTGGSGLEGVETSSAADISKIKASSYSNDLKGLEEYLVDIKYIPKSCTPTEMMYKVIGAEKGDRYYYTVNDSAVFVELYEYDTNNLNADAKRVIGEVKETGKFHVLSEDTSEQSAAFEATISDNGKFLLIYQGSTENDDLKKRKTDFEKAVKEFHK